MLILLCEREKNSTVTSNKNQGFKISSFLYTKINESLWSYRELRLQEFCKNVFVRNSAASLGLPNPLVHTIPMITAILCSSNYP